MTGLVPPEYQQLLIAGYVLGDLGPEEAAAFEQLLAADPSLIREVEQMQQALEMAYAAETPPPAHLKASILSAYELAQTAVAAPRRSTRVVALSGWIKGLGAIAAALIIGLVIDNYTLRRSLQAVRDVSTPATVLTFDLEPTETQISGSVNVVIDPDSLQGTLNVENLPPLQADQVYVLWTVVAPDAPVTADEKNAILTEVFTVNAAGEGSEQIAVPSVFRDRSLVKAVAITIENADAPQRHQSAPILIEQL